MEAPARTYTRRDHPATSHEAAASVAGQTVTLRERVYRAVEEVGKRGLTAEEIERETGLAGNTVRPRLIELREVGRVEQTDERRKTASGRNALVWVAVTEEPVARPRVARRVKKEPSGQLSLEVDA